MYDDKMYRYNALDAVCTMEVRNQIWDDLIADEYGPTYEMTTRMFEPLMFMMTRGIRVDQAALEETRRDIRESQERAQEELNGLAGRPLNALSPKDCQTYFYLEKGIKPYLNKEGNITTDDKAMQRIARGTAARPGLREAKLVQDIRGYNKLYSSYLDITFDEDGRMRCSYNPRGSKFGRLSSSKTIFGTGMNAQNLPQDFKKFLVADDGYFFVECDKRQAEWVVVAYLSQDGNMLDVIENNRDPHTSTASMMFKIDPSIIAVDNKVIGNMTDADEIRHLRLRHPDLIPFASELPRTMSGRQAGKKSNHGLNYDEGYRTFALMNEIPEHEAKRLIDLYHLAYPGVRNGFHEFVQNCLRKDRTLYNCFGRKIELRDAWGHDLFKSAYSAIPQSTVVDGLNQGMYDIYFDDSLSGTEGLNIDILSQVHDSILFQFPISVLEKRQLHKAIGLIYGMMSPEMEYHGRKFRIHTDMKVGWNWSGYHPDRNPRGMKEVSRTPTNAAEFHKEVHNILGIPMGGSGRGKKVFV